MRVQELLLEQHIGEAMKALNREFKELAKKYQLTLAAGMGWPNITKDGAWMGGGLAPLRGISDDKAALGIEKRRIGFLKAVAKKLEAFMADGRAVKIAKGGQRSVHNEVGRPGEVEQQLISNLNTEKPPGNSGYMQMPVVVWFVSAPADVSATSLVNIQASLYTMPNNGRIPGYQGFGTYNTFMLPNDQEFEKKLTRWFNKLIKSRSQRNTWSPEYYKLAHDLLVFSMKNGLPVRESKYSFEDIVSSEHVEPRLAFSKQRVVGKNAQVFPIEKILPVLVKHGFQP